MTSCSVAGCPNVGNYERGGKLYCQWHVARLSVNVLALQPIGKVNVEGREN